MEIYLIRHTTPQIESGICYGQSDIDVKHSYDDELKIIKEKITLNLNTTTVYSSPLLRCQKLATSFKDDVIIDERLMEVNFGDWELQKWDNINKEELDVWMKDFVKAAPPKGESYITLNTRVNAAFQEILNEPKSNKIIVTHGGVIRALLATLADINLKDSFSIKIPYGHVVKMIKDKKGLRITEGLILNDCHSDKS